ncbi:cobyrinate a,c-diamide synthase [Desulfothermus sp.]
MKLKKLNHGYPTISYPRILIGGLGGGSGKTIVTLGLIKSLRNKGFRIKPFKKGPDYIDSAWLALAAGESASNLDPFFMDEESIRNIFSLKAKGFDISVIEGNRGIFDGLDVEGSCSTAHLSKVLDAPVIVVVDCTKVTRTVAAMLLGCNNLEPDFKLKGVIFNRVAGSRHRKILTRSVERYTDIKVLGAIPKLKTDPIPERHMGLISHREYESEDNLNYLAQVVGDNVDLDGILKIARDVSHEFEIKSIWPKRVVSEPVNIGVVRDSSLWFYYEENLELLKACGANIVEFSLISDLRPPQEIHGIYLGGGFPETQADVLSKNKQMREWVFNCAQMGMPIYAECGGLMYLCREIVPKDGLYPMAGVFPCKIRIHKSPQGHGYTRALSTRNNPFFKEGVEFLGHEFHYSSCEIKDGQCEFVLDLKRGEGICNGKDGLLYKNTFASYNHIYGPHIPSWGMNFVRACLVFKNSIASKKIPISQIKAIF